PLFGSTRWVIGQWKEESKASPFVAQRFDNGVFHITVQNNDKREVVAAAPGNYNASYAFFTPGFRLELESENAPRDRVEFANALIDFETRSAEGAIDVPAYKRAIEEQDLDKFPFIADRPDYRNSDTFRIVKLGENPVLPNPTDGWVNMRYRIKGGRDGTGFLEVWANGEFIVRVEGAIGSDAFDGDTQYFKIGHYRDIESAFGWATVYVDNFKRGTVRDHVD
ncbi:MAG: heparin lyase I family protein, partial [Pseudomonadota bacterium]